MSALDLSSLTISKAKELLEARQISARDLTAAYLDEIKKRDPEINAYREVFGDALAGAAAVDEKLKNAENIRALEGIPFAIKDNILIEGKLAGAASKILEGYAASYDAAVIKKLREAGAIFLGRANMDEFAMGSSTENSAYGSTKNPHDVARVPGGSSGGSAAAVAGNMALAALGSDTGGSIRQPAAFCGVVGLKPTYGRVSRSGLMAMASSLDQIGPLTKTVEDAELIFEIIKGKNPKDSTTLEPPKNIGGGENAKTIGIPKEAFSLRERGNEGLEPEIAENISTTIDLLKKNGFEFREVSLPHIDYALAAYYIIMPAEVSANLSRFDGMRYGLREDGKNLLEVYEKTRGAGFGLEPRRRIILGSYVLSAGYYDAYYARAQKVRHLIREDFRSAFNSGIDVLLMPTTPHLPWRLGEKISDPLAMYLEDIFTVPINLAGVPAISLPVGFAEKEGANLPVGAQLVAPHFREDSLFEVGKVIESSLKSS